MAPSGTLSGPSEVKFPYLSNARADSGREDSGRQAVPSLAKCLHVSYVQTAAAVNLVVIVTIIIIIIIT